jgi:hypothetical protein
MRIVFREGKRDGSGGKEEVLGNGSQYDDERVQQGLEEQ